MIKAVGKRIVVEEIQLEPKTEGLLILPDKKDRTTAIVVSIGGEVDDNIELGDIVYMLPETGVPVEIYGVSYLSVTENQILAAWKDE